MACPERSAEWRRVEWVETRGVAPVQTNRSTTSTSLAGIFLASSCNLPAG